MCVCVCPRSRSPLLISAETPQAVSSLSRFSRANVGVRQHPPLTEMNGCTPSNYLATMSFRIRRYCLGKSRLNAVWRFVTRSLRKESLQGVQRHAITMTLGGVYGEIPTTTQRKDRSLWCWRCCEALSNPPAVLDDPNPNPNPNWCTLRVSPRIKAACCFICAGCYGRFRFQRLCGSGSIDTDILDVGTIPFVCMCVYK